MNEKVRQQHLLHLGKAEKIFKALRGLLVGQESALSRIVLASLSARPLTVSPDNGAEEILEARNVNACAPVLLMGNPGKGKTYLASIMALAISGDFERIQCTPDLQPTDITGTSVIQGENINFYPGPLLRANILLADELSRMPPKTQAALLAPTSEDAVWVSAPSSGGRKETKKMKISLKSPHFFIGSQNPRTEEGTYPIVGAALDRFAMILRFRPLTISELMSLQRKNEMMLKPQRPDRISLTDFQEMRKFIFEEMKVPIETECLIATLVQLLNPAMSGLEHDESFRALYEQIWEQQFDIQADSLPPRLVLVKPQTVSGSHLYRLHDFIAAISEERPTLFLRYLGKALAFTKTDRHGGAREAVWPSDIYKIYPDVMRNRIRPTHIMESLGFEWLAEAILDLVLQIVKTSDGFHSELPTMAERMALRMKRDGRQE